MTASNVDGVDNLFAAPVLIAAMSPFAVAGAHAQQAPHQTAALSETDRADIERAEEYLNSIRSLKSSFVQTASHGGVAEGTLYLQRPGTMRIDYKPPTPLQLFADGTWLIYLDSELQQVNQVPLNATPAAFLVRDHISLSGDIAVKRVTRRRGTLNFHLTQSENSDAGQLVVTLADSPLSLRGWTVIDAQGVETTVTLVGPSVNPDIPPRTFIYTPPDWAFPDSTD